MKKNLFKTLLVLAVGVTTFNAANAQNPTFNQLNIKFDTCYEGTNFGFYLSGTTINTIGLHQVIVTNTISSSEIFRDTFSFNQNFFLGNVDLDLGYNTVRFELWDSTFSNLYDSSFLYKNIIDKNCKDLTTANFIDANSNCDYEFEPLIPGISMGLYKNNALIETYLTTTNYKHIYGNQFLPTDTIKLKLLSNNYTSCLPNNEFEFQFDTFNVLKKSYHFAIDCNLDEDLYLSYASTYRTIAGPSYVYFTYGNNACDSAYDVEITYTFPTAYTIDTVSNGIGYNLSGNTITFDLGDLPKTYQGYFWMKLQNNDSLMMVGDTIYHTGIITPTTNDINIANNEFADSLQLIGSYDPNQKTTIPERYLEFDLQPIEYFIEFENLGNDTAFLVVLKDTLSDLLDYNTFEILGASHEYTLKLDEVNTNKILTISFPNINLADSTNKHENKGFFKYKIAPKTGLNYGQLILNTAYIYFDNNPAIVTNTTINELRPLSINTPNNNLRVVVYPNPVNNVLVIDNVTGKVASVNIYNVLGQKIHTQNISKGKTAINTASFANGIYMLECKGQNAEVKTIKFVKE